MKESLKVIHGDHFIFIFAKLINLLVNNLSADLRKRFIDSISIALVNSVFANDKIKEIFAKEKNPIFGLDNIINLVTDFSLVLAKCKEFDIAISYDCSGKGNVLSNEQTIKKIDSLFAFCSSSLDCQILEFLTLFLNSFNKTIGDSLCTLIVFEKCLKFMNLSISDVYELYSEFPNSFYNIDMSDISDFESDGYYMKIIKPQGIQAEIEECLASLGGKVLKCYFWLIPEDSIIKVFIEGKTLNDVEDFHKLVKNILERYDCK